MRLPLGHATTYIYIYILCRSIHSSMVCIYIYSYFFFYNYLFSVVGIVFVMIWMVFLQSGFVLSWLSRRSEFYELWHTWLHISSVWIGCMCLGPRSLVFCCFKKVFTSWEFQSRVFSQHVITSVPKLYCWGLPLQESGWLQGSDQPLIEVFGSASGYQLSMLGPSAYEV